MARGDICGPGQDLAAALFTRISDRRAFCQMRSIIASTASAGSRRTYGLDLSDRSLGQFLGRLLQQFSRRPQITTFAPKLEEAVAHRAPSARAATSHQNALPFRSVGYETSHPQFLAMALAASTFA